jgi:hypothetical protein
MYSKEKTPRFVAHIMQLVYCNTLEDTQSTVFKLKHLSKASATRSAFTCLITSRMLIKMGVEAQVSGWTHGILSSSILRHPRYISTTVTRLIADSPTRIALKDYMKLHVYCQYVAMRARVRSRAIKLVIAPEMHSVTCELKY